MVNIPVITKRELHAFFLSPVAYIVLTGFAIAQGIMFVVVLEPPIDPVRTAEWVLRIPVYLLMVAAPALTMRLLSEETAGGTIETMMTAPVTETELVLGKFCGALVFAVVMFLPLVAQMAFLGLYGKMDVGPVLAGFMGLFLLTAQYLAIGLLCSALTRAQVASAIMTFAVLLALAAAPFLAGKGEAALPRLLRYVAPVGHCESFAKGIVDTRDLAYLVITIVLALFLTVRALDLRKWR